MAMTKRLIILLMISMLVSACKVGPNYQRPKVQAPAEYRGVANPGAQPDPQTLADTKWFDVFKDEKRKTDDRGGAALTVGDTGDVELGKKASEQLVDMNAPRVLKDADPGVRIKICEGLGNLIATFDPEFQQRLKNRVLLAGGGSMIKGLDVAIEQEMHKRLGSGKCMRIQEPVYGGSNGALKIAHDMPAEFWEKLK